MKLLTLKSSQTTGTIPILKILTILLKTFKDTGITVEYALLKRQQKNSTTIAVKKGLLLADKNFTVRYNSNIPVQVGLAGSSAIVTATIRALTTFFGIEIPKPLLPGLILSVETDELSISAGLQDRVVQVYDGLVYMDFDKNLLDKQGHGYYENIDPNLLPPIYLAYISDLSEVSGIAHGNLKGRYMAGDQQVIDAMKYFAERADMAKDCLLSRQPEKLGKIMNENFDKTQRNFSHKSFKPGNDQPGTFCWRQRKIFRQWRRYRGNIRRRKNVSTIKRETERNWSCCH